MGQRGYESAAEKADPRAEPAVPDLVMPASLTQAEVAIWLRITRSVGPGFFRPGDESLLVIYCRTTVQYEELSRKLEQGGMMLEDRLGRVYVNPAQGAMLRVSNVLASLAVRLRLCPSARLSSKGKLANEAPKPVEKRPWEDGDGDTPPPAGVPTH